MPWEAPLQSILESIEGPVAKIGAAFDMPSEQVDGMRPEAVHDAVRADGGTPGDVIFLTPDGETLDQPIANGLSLASQLTLVAGHYKGIDERVREALVTREISVGDYVLSGGELPALVLIDAVARLVPGVLGDAQSALGDIVFVDLPE